jgi:hypothetical protein
MYVFSGKNNQNPALMFKTNLQSECFCLLDQRYWKYGYSVWNTLTFEDDYICREHHRYIRQFSTSTPWKYEFVTMHCKGSCDVEQNCWTLSILCILIVILKKLKKYIFTKYLNKKCYFGVKKNRLPLWKITWIVHRKT